MRKYITLFFSVSFLLSACKGGGAPDGIIKNDVMVRLLTDVHIIDGRMFSVKPEPDSLYKYGTGRYLALFRSYHTDSAQFKRSLKYYTGQPAEMTVIYEQVLKNLKQKTDSLNTVQAANARKTDSLLRISNARISDSIKKIQTKGLRKINSLNKTPQGNALPK